jgi:LPXTG-motif cell wall-anchored protein
MKHPVRRIARLTVTTAGLAVAGVLAMGSMAYAVPCGPAGPGASAERGGSTDITAGNNGTGNGNQVDSGVQAPVNVCGVATSVTGVAVADCGSARVRPPRACTPPVSPPEQGPPPAETPEEPNPPAPVDVPTKQETPEDDTPVAVQPATPGGGADQLPVTGAPAGALIGVGAALLAAGGGLIVAGRRRRLARHH